MPRKPKHKAASEPAIPDDRERHFVKKSLSSDSEHHEVHARPGKKHTDDKRVEEQLLAIYENPDGTLPDMKSFEKRRSQPVIRALVMGALFLVTLGGGYVLGQKLWGVEARFGQEKVALEVNGPAELTAGSEVSYRIRYRNAEAVALKDARLELRLPEGFVVTKAEPAPVNDKKTIWDFKDLPAGSSGFVEITGHWYADPEERGSFEAFLNYTPSNFSSEFQALATYPVAIAGESPVELTIDGPNRIAPGEATTFTITVKPKGISAESARVVLDPGASFTMSESSPAPDVSQPNSWVIDPTAPSTVITVKGSFGTAADEVDAPFKVSVEGTVRPENEPLRFVIGQAERVVKVLPSALEVRLAVNGGTGKLSVAPGDTLSSSIVVKNNGKDALTGVRVRFALDAPSHQKRSVINWNKLVDSHDGEVIGEQIDDLTRRGIIIWSEEQVADLSELAPGEEVVFDVQVPIKNGSETSLVNYTSNKLSASVEVQYDGESTPEIRRGPTVEMVMSSDLAFDVREKIQGNTHAISWVLENSFHELKDVVVEADFYGDIAFEQSALSVPIGSATFDDKAKRLTWRIPTLPTAIDVAALEFEVVLKINNPTQTNLSSKVRIKALDTVTGETITRSGDEILLN